MYSLILKITHTPAIKDSIAVLRGVYKVAEGGIAHGNIRQSSWIDSNPQLKHKL